MRRPELDRLEAIVLASGVLLFVPGARAIWAWPWLWLVPGWFFARRVLGLREGFALAALSLVTSIAFSTLVCLPLTVLMGGPRTWCVVASVALFALACAFSKRDANALPDVPWPPLPALILCAGFVAFRMAVAFAEVHAPPHNADDVYLDGVVRELATTFPPSNPIAATTLLKQPWGYWMLYALTHATSGLSIATTLSVASIVLAMAFLAAVHLVATTLSGDVRAGGLAMALALGAGELLWIEDLVAPTTTRLVWETAGMASFPMNLVDAYYDVPVLVVALAVVYAYCAGRVTLAAAFAAVAPFFHPVHASVLYGALALTVAVDAVRGRRPRAKHLWLFATPLPFVLLYVLVYAHGLAAHTPFVPRLSSSNLGWYVRYAGAFVPFAVVGAWRTPRSPMTPLFMSTTALSIATVAANYHWTADLLSTSTIVLGGIGLAALTRRHRLGVALAVVVVVATIFAADYPRRLAPPSDRRSAAERTAGQWVHDTTPARAIFAVDHRSVPAVTIALGLGERRVFLGPTYQLLNTASVDDVDERARANLAILASPCEARRKGIDYVLFERRAKASTPKWSDVTPAAFENDAVVIYAVASARCP